MEISGRIVSVLPEQSGQSANGTWRKQQFILETPGQYPKKVCVMVWGDKIEQMSLAEGAEVTAHIDVESREFNGRWYTDVKAWKVESKGATSAEGAPPPDPTTAPEVADDSDADDLPF
jgi:hypothetical protein